MSVSQPRGGSPRTAPAPHHEASSRRFDPTSPFPASGPFTAPPLRDRRGFGLIEALVALVLLSIGVLAVAGLTFSVGQQTRTASFRSHQMLAARQVMEDALAAPYDDVSDHAETVPVPGGALDVTLDVTEDPYLTGEEVKRLRVTVQAVGTADELTWASWRHEPRNPAAAVP